MVLLGALSSGRSDKAWAHEPAREGATGDERRCSAGEQQPHNECLGHNECFGFTAARLGDDPAEHCEQHVPAGVTYSETEEAGSSEAPLADAGSATAPDAPTSATTDPAGSTGNPAGAPGSGRSDSC